MMAFNLQPGDIREKYSYTKCHDYGREQPQVQRGRVLKNTELPTTCGEEVTGENTLYKLRVLQNCKLTPIASTQV